MKIEKMKKGDWGKVVAFFDLATDEGFVVKGFKIVKSKEGGFFVGMPSQKNKEGEYYNTIFAPKILSQQLNKLAIEHYNGEVIVEDSIKKEEQTINEMETNSGNIPF